MRRLIISFPLNLSNSGLVAWFMDQPALPWRDDRDPYRIWILETMAQQTTISVVLRRYPLWLAQFPTVSSLALAEETEVLRAWEGLGYYSRARNLHLSAKQIVGLARFPQTQAQWLALPGVGLYTANSVISRAFEQPVLAFDANLKRIFMRVQGVNELTARREKELEQQLLPWLESERAAVINQAFMRLGQLHCKKKPLCVACPLSVFCVAYQTQQTDRIPPVKVRETTALASFVLVLSHQQQLLLEQRTQGVGKGMFSFPRLSEQAWEQFKGAHPDLKLYPLPPTTHSYTRYRETLTPFYAYSPVLLTLNAASWHAWDSVASLPMMSVYRLIAENAAQLAPTVRG